MSTDASKDDRKDYEVSCEFLNATDLDMTESMPQQLRANVPVGGFVREETMHDTTELDFSGTSQQNGTTAPRPATDHTDKP